MKRSPCPITCSLDILGDKWTLIVMRDALFRGFTTYGQFLSSPEGISTNILAARLKKMVADGIFETVNDPDNKLKIHYILTEKGRDLKEVLMAVGMWGSKYIEGTFDMAEKVKSVRPK